MASSDIFTATVHNCRPFFNPLNLRTHLALVSGHCLYRADSFYPLVVPQIVDKLSAFYEPRSFITEHISVSHLVLNFSYMDPVRTIQSSLRSILTPTSHLCLGLPSRLFPSYCPINTMHVFIDSPKRATCSTHPILLDLTNTVIYGGLYESCRWWQWTPMSFLRVRNLKIS